MGSQRLALVQYPLSKSMVKENQTQQDCCGVGYVAARGLAAAVLNTSLEDDTSKKPDSSKVSSTSRQVDFLTHVMKQRKT